MTDLSLAAVSFGRRLATLAEQSPEAVAVTYAPPEGEGYDIAWAELDLGTNRVARVLADRGVDEDATVVVGLPNRPEHFVAAIAAWKLGAMVLPVSARLPKAERDAILALAQATVTVAEWEDGDFLAPADLLAAAAGLSAAPLPDVVPHPGKAIASGGSTGRSKIIVDPNPLAYPPEVIGEMTRTWMGVGEGDEVQLVAGPLYHNLPFGTAHMSLFLGHRLVLMGRFDAARAVGLIEAQRVTFFPTVPTMMHRMLLLEDIAARDLSSLRSVFHTAAPCPAWVKRGWIDLIGGERVFELYGATEAVGICTIRGDEWLAHPGSVGRPTADSELRILDEEGQELPPGEVGEVFMRRGGGEAATYTYVGSPSAKATPDGFVSVGDLGHVDEDGYLYLADRRADLIITGGANVYPAEVEVALSEHPGVLDSAVVGLPSEEWGKTVHAIVEPRDPGNPPVAEDLDRHCRERLAPYKIPKSWELVATLPRDEAGKIRRSALAAERAPLSSIASE